MLNMSNISELIVNQHACTCICPEHTQWLVAGAIAGFVLGWIWFSPMAKNHKI